MRGETIAIVGGGPAGAVAAAKLAAAGASVTLFHREPRGERGKPCGGGVLPAAFRGREALVSPRVAHVDVRRLELRSPSGRSVAIESELLFRVFRRRDLDASLRDEARSLGASIALRAVTRVCREGRSFRVECGAEALRFDRIVGADGVRSLVRASLAEPLGDEDLMRALGYEVTGLSPPHGALVAFERGLRGYLWVFPRPAGASIGVCGDAATTPRGDLRDRLDRFARREEGLSFGRGGERSLVSWFIPALSARALERPVVDGDGFALVGDAAGTADPVTAEGIRPSIESAEALARSWDEGVPYAGALGRDVLPALRASAALKNLFYSPLALEATVALCARSATLRSLLVDLVRGDAGTEGLGSRIRRDALGIAAEAVAGAKKTSSPEREGLSR